MKLLYSNSGITKAQSVIMVIVVIVALGAAAYYYSALPSSGPFPSSTTTPTNVENVGGVYNATIRYGEMYGEVEYTDEDGEHTGVFLVQTRNALDWIKANTAEDAVFLCWWDYGHMIKGYAERNVVVCNPSEEILESIADPTRVKEFDPHEKILDVAKALTTNDFNELTRIIAKYGVTHLLVCTDDLTKAYWFFRIAGLTWEDYLIHSGSSFEFTDMGKQTMIARLLENRNVGFPLIFEDQEVKVYKTNSI